jgi:AAA domain
MKLTDLSKDTTFLRVLQCGPSGIGKTCGASTFPKPLYYADMEDGIKSLLAFYDYDRSKMEGIEYDQYLDKDPKNPTAFLRLDQKLTEMEHMPVFPYKTIVVDSLTTLEDRIMNKSIKDVPTKRVKNKVANQQDYGLVIWDIEEFIQRLLTLPCHVVLNCHMQVIQNELTREVLEMPLVVGKKLPQKLPIWFDEVYRVVIKDGKRQWQLRPEGMITQPKTRILPKSTPTFIDQEYAQLAKYLGN